AQTRATGPAGAPPPSPRPAAPAKGAGAGGEARAPEPVGGPVTATLDAPATASDPLIAAAWEAAVTGVNDAKRMLGAFLQACRLEGVTETHVVLAMDDLHRAVVDEKENRAIISREVGRAFGRPLVVRCVPLGEGPARPSVQDLEPLIDRAIAWCEGEVIEPGPPAPGRVRG
ncbi:MAG: hypothetical protein ACRENJ_07710, partial [Candidatus Eiseniibacteriota bacterium]